jgi:hypothetical protein
LPLRQAGHDLRSLDLGFGFRAAHRLVARLALPGDVIAPDLEFDTPAILSAPGNAGHSDFPSR